MEALRSSRFIDVLKVVTKETSWLSALTIGLFTFYLVQLWMKVRELPKGPFPLPILGNILSFRSKREMVDIMMDFKKRYGGIFTLFAAGQPIIVVTDWELVKEALITKRNDIISRTDIRSFHHFQTHFMGIINEKNDRNWEVTRKVGAAAIRKFVDGEILARIVHDNTNLLVDKMLKYGKPFEPALDIQMTIIAIIAETAFGAKNLSKSELRDLLNFFEVNQKLSGNTPGDLATWLLVLFYNRDLSMKRVAVYVRKFLTEKCTENNETYQRGEIRNFTDAVMASKLEAAEEDNDVKDYLDNENMMKIIGALFVAATETTATALRWMTLLMANFPEVQEKLIAEIDQNIGDRMPSQSDRRNCPYTWAFIQEALRFRTPIPFGLPHVANTDTEVGGHKIRRGNWLVFFSHAVHMDPEIFPEPNKFKPERFLNADGTFNVDRAGFLAFGEGKRICLGEKMARNDIFLFLASFLQKVKVDLDGPKGYSNLAAKSSVVISIPKPYKIILTERK